MKKRIITAAIAIILAIGIVILSKIKSIFLMAPIAALVVISVLELAHCIKIESKMLKGCSVTYAGLVPFLVTGNAMYHEFTGQELNVPLNTTVLLIATILYVLVMLHSMIKHYTSVKFEQVATLVFGTIGVSLGISLLGVFHDFYFYYPVFSKGDSMFIFIYAMVVCWTFDGGAYFIGSAFGKHKMAPNISPKKTWEGYIGGIVIGDIASVGYFLLFKWLASPEYQPEMFTWGMIAIISPILATLSIMGDLSASTIKRNFGVKDFSNFFPGHGGVLDRFDSVLYVTPILYAILKVMVMIKS